MIVNRLSLQESVLLEGVNDPGILKAVILAGGPGSGKGFVSRELFGIPRGASYAPSGMKILNSDRVLEYLLKKEGLPLDLNTLKKTDSEAFKRVTDNNDPNSLMNISRRVNASLWKRYTDERLGIIVDGTGANIDIGDDPGLTHTTAITNVTELQRMGTFSATFDSGTGTIAAGEPSG